MYETFIPIQKIKKTIFKVLNMSCFPEHTRNTWQIAKVVYMLHELNWKAIVFLSMSAT